MHPFDSHRIKLIDNLTQRDVISYKTSFAGNNTPFSKSSSAVDNDLSSRPKRAPQRPQYCTLDI